MSYTNIELVNYHINITNQSSGQRCNHEIVLNGLDWIDLPGANILESSVVIKAIRNNTPYSESVILGDSVLSLSNSDLLANSVTVASDSSLGTIYTENIDYTIDYSSGTITRIEEGNIVDNASLTVWYYYYSHYLESSDYQVNYKSAKIKRLASGDIGDNQTVCADYNLTATQVGEDAILEAVSEANAIIESRIDPDGRFGADLTLQTAATYLAVSIVSRMLAVEEMKVNQSNHNVAASWLSIAESYRSDYETILKSFKPEASRMNYPTHS